ncbi:MAG: DNA repair protein RadC [Treponema sp.]|nr:DNA repair protein RadC [Treponema sp.]
MYVNNKPDIREKALRFGLGYPLDYELVMLILGAGNRQMSVEAMSKKIVEVLDSSNNDDMVERLLKMKGIGQSKALAVAAAIELGKRRTCHLGAHIKSPSDVIPFVNHYAMNGKEHFLAVTLNGGHNIIQIHVVSIGTTNSAFAHPREVFYEAIKENATAVIVCHNHPSGTVEPSEEDIYCTKKLVEASEIIGIPLLDHIIIDCSSYFSFMESGLLKKLQLPDG